MNGITIGASQYPLVIELTKRKLAVKRYLTLLLSVALLAIAIPADAEEQRVGIVLLHGKQDKAPYYVGALAQKLRSARYLVATPEMPWSANRIYDASYEDAMLEIDKAVTR